MVSITVFYRKTSAAWLLALLLSLPVQADFSIQNVTAELREGNLFVSANLDLSLNEKVEEAVSKGIPLDILIEVRLKRPRPILWDETISEWSMVRKLSYHALSSQYLVHSISDAQIESFTSLSQALGNMGTLNEHLFPMNHFAGKDDIYSLEMRASLNIESLPAPLRPVAYTSLDWRLNSGWTQWPTQP